MKDKFKQWADAIRAVAKPVYTDKTMHIVDADALANEAADFLQRIVDISEQEPDDIVPRDGDSMVTKANRDWWMVKAKDRGIKLFNANTELDAANARIAELEQYKEWVAPQLEHAIEIEHANNKADQPRPLLTPEQWTALELVIRMADRGNLEYSNGYTAMEELRKLLVGS